MRRKRRFRSLFTVEACEPRHLLSKTIYVDVNTPGANHDGTSWATAFVDLQQAIAASLIGDELHVADGTYKPSSTGDRLASFQMGNGVAMVGGYAGNGAPNPDARDVSLYPSILSGNIGNASSALDNSCHVVYAAATNSTGVLDGFTITAGQADGSPVTLQGDRGGGIYIGTGAPTIRNCTFTANYASRYGGAMFINTASPSITNCTFSLNSTTSSSANGGAMYINGGAPSVTASTFTQNSISGTGGAVYNKAASTFVNCTFSGNTDSRYGGGIFSTGASLVIAGCTFTGNKLAVASWSPPAVLPKLVNCTFVGNNVALSGAVNAVNCLFNNNTNGAVINLSSLTTLTNCTFVNNRSIQPGSAILSTSLTAAPTITNCIFWGNTTVGSPISSAGPISISYSDVQGGWSGAGSGNVDVDPVFVDPDGPNNIPGDLDDDFRLRAGSPVADAGNNAAPHLVGITSDRAGAARFSDIPTQPDSGAGTSPMVDIGAYEASISGIDVEVGGMYRVLHGQAVQLGVHGASDAPGAISYVWDLDNDGQFDDGAGPTAVFSAAGILDGFFTVKVRMTDSQGRNAVDSTMVKVLPTVLYVDDSAAGAKTGFDWANAYSDLQVALAEAVPGNEIHVAQGTYRPSAIADQTVWFALKNGVALVGGYAGYGAVQPDVRDTNLTPAILSGAYPTSRSETIVLSGEGINSTAVLDGFTVSGGRTGMSNFWSSPVVRNCTFRDNFTDRGAGMYNWHASPVLTNCFFIENRGGDGGAMYAGYSSITLTNCVFTRNIADPPWDQSASAQGGSAMFLYESSVSIIGCSFNGNNSGSRVHNMIQIMPGFPSSVRAINCTFVGNQYAPYSWGNLDTGGAWNCTFAANPTGTFGFSGTRLFNSIVWGHAKIGTIQAQYSDIQVPTDGVGNISADPMFVRNPSPGADSVWGTADDDYGDLRLQPTSPCIDAGSNTLVPAGVATDIVGNPRIVDVSGVHGFTPIVDMGGIL